MVSTCFRFNAIANEHIECRLVVKTGLLEEMCLLIHIS